LLGIIRTRRSLSGKNLNSFLFIREFTEERETSEEVWKYPIPSPIFLMNSILRGHFGHVVILEIPNAEPLMSISKVSRVQR
jgi:hypothetical protein